MNTHEKRRRRYLLFSLLQNTFSMSKCLFCRSQRKHLRFQMNRGDQANAADNFECRRCVRLYTSRKVGAQRRRFAVVVEFAFAALQTSKQKK